VPTKPSLEELKTLGTYQFQLVKDDKEGSHANVSSGLAAANQFDDENIGELEGIIKNQVEGVIAKRFFGAQSKNSTILNIKDSLAQGRNAVVDLIAGRRPTISGWIIGGIGLGIVAGALAVVLTVVLPPMGLAAIAAGATAATVLAAGGTAAGTITIGAVLAGVATGAVIGGYAGEAIGKKRAKDEKHYDLPKRCTDRLQTRFPFLDIDTIYKMRAYAYNKSELTGQTIVNKIRWGSLSKLGDSKKEDQNMMLGVADSFCSELFLLTKELRLLKRRSPSGRAEIDESALRRDINVVRSILEKIKAGEFGVIENRDIDAEIKKALEICQDVEIHEDVEEIGTSEEPKPILTLSSKPLLSTSHHVGKPLSVVEKSSISSNVVGIAISHNEKNQFINNQIEKIKNEFLDAIKGTYVVMETSKREGLGTLQYRYRIKPKNQKQELPEIWLQHKASTDDNPSLTEVLVDKNAITKDNQSDVYQVLVAQAKAFSQSTTTKDNLEVIVMSGGDKTLAIQLMAEALKAGLNPTLDSEEYPSEASRRKIEDAAAKMMADIEPNDEEESTKRSRFSSLLSPFHFISRMGSTTRA